MVKQLENVSWTAEEYITRDHNAWWYIGLVVVTGALSTIAVLFAWWTFLILVALSAITILILNLRPPRKIHYLLNETGLKEGETLHKYSDFKSFGILKENNYFSAVLIPKKRFSPGIKVYFPETSGEAIVDALGNHLPMEDVKLDFIDKIVNFLRI